MRVEEPKQLGELVIEIAGKKLQITECGNGMLLCSKDGREKHKIGYDSLNQKLKETLEQKKLPAVPEKKISKFSKCQERLGEINTNTAGETMEIVKYNSCEDMTVRFEDGTEKVGVRYDKFRQGYVQKPESCDDGISKKKPHHTARKSEKRLGEIRKNNVGETMEIVQYNNANNMTVRFEDGTEKAGVSYFNFERGNVSKYREKDRTKEERLGEVRKNNAGETMEIVGYHSANNLTVRFEDGTARTGVEYTSFKKGTIRKVKSRGRDVKREERLGETNTNPAGETMEIVKYNNCKDMTVRFEDGTEREGVQYTQFKKGNLRKPKREPVVNREFLQKAEAYLVSAKALLEGNESTLVPSVVLCKKAVLNFLKSALESRTEGKTSEGETEDIRFLGREVKEKTGVSFDPRDLAWLNDFDFKQRERWLQPTTEDVIMAIEMVEKIGREVNKVVPKT